MVVLGIKGSEANESIRSRDTTVTTCLDPRSITTKCDIHVQIFDAIKYLIFRFHLMIQTATRIVMFYTFIPRVFFIKHNIAQTLLANNVKD